VAFPAHRRVEGRARTPARAMPPLLRATPPKEGGMRLERVGSDASGWDDGGLYVGGLPFEADATDVRAWIDEVCRYVTLPGFMRWVWCSRRSPHEVKEVPKIVSLVSQRRSMRCQGFANRVWQGLAGFG
jgi:hypothetical protein